MTMLSQEIFWPILLSVLAIGNPSPPSALIGRWGGDRVTLIVNAEQGRLGLDCGTGSFPNPVAIHRNGNFSASGTLENYRSGPAYSEIQAGAVQATFNGRIKGDLLTLDVASADGKDRRQYRMVRNRRTKLVRCL